MQPSVSAIFTGANHQNQVSDYNKQKEIIAFGAGKNIALWRPLDQHYKGVYTTLKGHESEVTCCRFLSESLLVSTSEDFKIKIWEFDDNTDSNAKCIQTIDHYTHTVTTLDCDTQTGKVFATGSADGKVSIWCGSAASTQFELKHEFLIKKNVFPLCVSIQKIEETDAYLLAVGGTIASVFIYSFLINETNNFDIENFQQAACMEGHEDWIKCLDFRRDERLVYTLATGSQDRYIRLWKIDIAYKDKKIKEQDSKKLSLLSNKKYKFQVSSQISGAINFEALIMGHDDWVSSIKWHETKEQLLASTANTELMVWEPEEASGIWICNSRLGELSSKGASTATGSSGGFWSCLWFTQNNTEYVFTNGKTGSWRCWSCPLNSSLTVGDANNKTEEAEGETQTNDEEEDVLAFRDSSFKVWKSELAITGPYREATDVAWSNDGYLLATSLDQTTRLFSKWLLENSQEKFEAWKEFSRPQIHGYDMVCVEPITNTSFISGGDEKILRSFDEPRGVAQILDKFSDIHLNSESMPESASLPVLGLSNKATADAHIRDDEDQDVRETEENTNITYDLISSLTGPPVEDQLQRHTLWPEIEKLYGHGYEITCVDVSPDKQIVATACRSNTKQHAVIRIFDTTTWLQLKPVLPFHNLTVTRLRFSKDNKYLLSVSRDRQWAVWERNMADNSFVLKYKNEKPHTRIIWDAEWCPLEFDNAFITASRDKSLKIWSFDDNDFKLKNVIKLNEPITALSVLNSLVQGKVIVAVGKESGDTSIFSYDHENGFASVVAFDPAITPSGRNNRLRWRPVSQKNIEDPNLMLASASQDNSVRIYAVPKDLF